MANKFLQNQTHMSQVKLTSNWGSFDLEQKVPPFMKMQEKTFFWPVLFDFKYFLC